LEKSTIILSALAKKNLPVQNKINNFTIFVATKHVRTKKLSPSFGAVVGSGDG
jgi:hypothetical protein